MGSEQGVVTFMRSEGINVSQSDDVKVITKTLFMSLVKSEVFKTNFIRWAESRYKNESNYSGENYASGFDPMATQGSGQEFDAMSSQQGANLKEDGFANASGEFDTMSTQSGGFSTTETQFANVSGLFKNVSMRCTHARRRLLPIFPCLFVVLCSAVEVREIHSPGIRVGSIASQLPWLICCSTHLPPTFDKMDKSMR